MSLLVAPAVRGIPGPKSSPHFSVNFTYEFFGDAPAPQNLGGLNFTGSIYSFDVTALKTSASLPSFRSLQFSQTYCNDDTPGQALDGELIIFVPSSGQLVRFGCPSNTSNSHLEFPMVSGVIPIIANKPTQIVFGKRQNANTAGTVFGKLIATLFDFDVDPYLLAGFSAKD